MSTDRAAADDDIDADYARVKTLFGEVCELPDEAARRARLIELGADAQISQRVLALLAQDGATRQLSAPVEAMLLDASEQLQGAGSELQPGDRLGAWTLQSELGHGGMGRVFLAERSDGHYQQRAAVKLLLGWSGAEARAQLARERQILASLNHPHIARLLDGGTTPGGRPYLVMEYIEGQRIDRFCAERSLDLQARLALFAQVCEALAYAHRQLVIHCDIKPGNVLVTAEGRAMLLDFGIARLQDQEQSGHSGLTPRYASPEQQAGLPPTVSSDIYSLGRMLDDLLQPLGRQAARREEWQAIVARASASEPALRYLSVAALQSDLRRFHQHLPLTALPRRWPYLTRKLLRRRWPWVLAAAVGLLMAGGFTLRLVQERDRALQAEGRARAEAATAEQVSEMMIAMFEGADPAVSGRPDLSAAALVDKGREHVQSDLGNQPALQARMRSVLGRAYENMGQPRPAIELYQQAAAQLGAQGRLDEQAAQLSRLAMALGNTGRHAEAEVPARQALALRERLGSPALELADARDTLGYVLARLGRHDEAEPLLSQALQTRRAAEQGPDRLVAVSLHHLGMLAANRARWEEAEARLREALAIKQQLFPPEHPTVLNSVQQLAAALTQLRRLDEAQALLRELLQRRRQVFGVHSAPYATALNELGSALQDAGQAEQAVPLYREAMGIVEALQGRRSATFAVDLNNLATALEDLGDPAAEAAYRESLAIRQAVLPAGDLSIARAQHNLARWLLRQGRAADALPLAQAALQGRLARLKPEHQDCVDSRLLMTELSLNLGQPAQARAQLDTLLPLMPQLRPLRQALLQRMLARELLQPPQQPQQRAAALKAIEWLQMALPTLQAQLPPKHLELLRTQLLLTTAQRQAGQGAAAARTWQDAMSRAASLPPRHPLRRATEALKPAPA
ncbi:serine/threonine-protein kinase [Paucibacter sp. APW11]|uniref:Serine/threonine-protein kinase n=1 Tax=Roseateles aquae TaxID=3077235 RepID=A0ABU3P8K7_9BURK|nr:serine/threonine-protein kinase [Paucibacter sp. APW11]MDT8998423.1 serine/threonine-protein kinase [Paucibacter sp. APW11]